ncbi:MAG: chloride channel protein [Psychroflexus sp.]|jgi:CIC family chloride channel protein|nr:chloride channel protein [Psychroflexus sp.]MDR9449414.1 chloride channel protein [Psychroflexus sp.]
MGEDQSFYKKILIWRYRNISDDTFLFILSIIVGLLAGLGSVLIKNLTYVFSLFLKNNIDSYFSKFYFLTPVLGFFMAMLLSKYVIKKQVGHGIPTALASLSKREGRMDFKDMFSSVLTAPITVSFGGSAGLEGPSVATGSSIGSNLSRLFHIKASSRKLLLVCGAAASLSAIFKAPIAAILFAIEVFSLDFTFSSLLPLLLASVSAVFTRLFFLSEQYLIDLHEVDDFDIGNLGFFILFGILTAFVSLYFTKAYIRVEEYLKTIKNDYKRTLLAGIGVGILVFIARPLYGEGFEFMNTLIKNDVSSIMDEFLVFEWFSNQWVVLGFIVFLILVKPIATSLTLNGGGVGGIFAPTLFLGVITGSFFLKVMNLIGFELPESNFTMLGMAGLLAGILQAPLTAVFLIAEVTGGYNLIVPLMVIVSISFFISKKFVDHNIYTRQLKKDNELITHNKDQTVLMLLRLRPIIEKNFISLNPKMTFKEMLHQGVAKSSRNLFPVVNDDDKLVGVITLDDIREFMFDEQSQNTYKVEYLMHQPPDFIYLEKDDVRTAIDKFQKSGAWNLPVISNGRYAGFISKSKLLTAYRQKLLEVTDE